MDAIRRSLEPRPDPIARLADGEGGVPVASLRGDGRGASATVPGGHDDGAHEVRTARAEPVVADSGTSRAFLLRFHDVRPPNEVQALCEREVMTRFVAAGETHPLAWRAEADVNGAAWTFVLTFEAALAQGNRYVLRAEAAWTHLAEMHHEYERRSSTSWFALWTRDLAAVEADASDAVSRDRYAALRAAALEADARLDSVDAGQRAIVAGMTRGGRYSTSHKEGGTNITWQHDRFVRSDYGDDPALETFTDEAAFLAMLWNFGRWDATRHARDGQRSELDTWVLILRRMRVS